jgi:hypothetical protein
MSKVRRYGLLAVLVAVGAAAYVSAGPPPPTRTAPGTFAFAVLGDSPYHAWEDLKYRVVLQDLRAHDLGLVLHIGDMLWRPCTDARYRSSLDGFNSLPHPVIYTPGDNEWADCWASGAGGFRPLERLARLREMFFGSPESLGRRRVPLTAQGRREPFAEFVENVRWVHGGLAFATVHLVGSANGSDAFPGRGPEDDAEVVRRTAAATVWVRETFAEARTANAAAVVIGFHANPGLGGGQSPDYRHFFEPFLTALEEEVEAFGKPVLIAHGDNHVYTVDHPVVRRTTGRLLENLTRLQVPGSPGVGWVRVAVTPGPKVSFAFEPRVVPRWKLW